MPTESKGRGLAAPWRSERAIARPLAAAGDIAALSVPDLPEKCAELLVETLRGLNIGHMAGPGDQHQFRPADTGVQRLPNARSGPHVGPSVQQERRYVDARKHLAEVGVGEGAHCDPGGTRMERRG